MGPCNRLNALSWLWGEKKRQMVLLNFLIIFHYLMLNQILPGLSTKIFRILHYLDENNHQNSSWRSQSWSGLCISPWSTSYNWIHSPKQHEFLHVYICFWYTFLTQKVNLTKGENSLTYLHHNVRTRKRLHDIPRFLILFLGQDILIIIYRTCNI